MASSPSGPPHGLRVVAHDSVPPPAAPYPPPVRVAVLGKRIGSQLLEHETAPQGLDICTVRSCAKDFERDLENQHCEILIVELEQLGHSPHETLQRLVRKAGANRSIVLYDYASRHLLGRLAECCSARAIQYPISLEELRQVVLDAAALSGVINAINADLPAPRDYESLILPRRFTDVQLGRLAEVPTTVECECPNHLARLAASLAAFERYEASCETESSADEEVHGWLHVQAARARYIIERALERLIEHDGIEI